MKSKTSAGILALFLGGIGVHRFYLGQAGLGILYLLFFWTLLPAIAALIDGIIFLTQSEEAFDAKYNKGITRKNMVVDVADELSKLNDLKEKGVITEHEFQNRKTILLG